MTRSFRFKKFKCQIKLKKMQKFVLNTGDVRRVYRLRKTDQFKLKRLKIKHRPQHRKIKTM